LKGKIMNSLNIHILFSFAAGNPNRDDTGSPKAVSYGGTTRARISSQAMTRPKRLRFEAQTDGEKTHRSALVGDEMAKQAQMILESHGTVVDEKLQITLRRAAAKSALGLAMKQAKADKKAEAIGLEGAEEVKQKPGEEKNAGDDEDEAGDTLVWLAESEINEAALKLASKFDETIDPATYVHAKQTKSLSIAAFGRMFAQRPDLQNEAAIQRSHAFTTHESEVEVDYFTAVDDLRTLDRGAGHINMTMLTGGVYYWHCNVDARQLFATWSGASEEGALDKLIELFSSLFEALPSGKQNTTGYQGLPAVVLAVPARSAVSLQSAFESPIMAKDAGYLQPSIQALVEEYMTAREAKPSHFSPAAVAVASKAVAEALGAIHLDEMGISLMNLEELAIWCAKQVLNELSLELTGMR